MAGKVEEAKCIETFSGQRFGKCVSYHFAFRDIILRNNAVSILDHLPNKSCK